MSNNPLLPGIPLGVTGNASNNTIVGTTSTGTLTLQNGQNAGNITTTGINVNGYMCNTCGQWQNANQIHNCQPVIGINSAPNTFIGGNWPVQDMSSIYTTSTIESLLNIRHLYETGKCTKCKEDKTLVMGYRVLKIERKLCQECLLSVADKIFGVETDSKLESALYGS